MVKLYSVKEMQALEKEANEKGLSYELMMANAGKGIAENIRIAYSQLHNKKIFAIIGSGNNGGDALVALGQLAGEGWQTSAYIVRPREAGDPLVKRLAEQGGAILQADDDRRHAQLNKLIENYDVMLDGVFGTGIKLPLKEDTGKLLGYIKTAIAERGKQLHVVAVDCPSGVDCETGEAAEETIPAEMTITMAGLKVGLTKLPAAKLAGEMSFASIGEIESLASYKANPKMVITGDWVKEVLPQRSIEAHKGTFGTALVIAGSVNYTGAALLAGKAAYRSGAGLVTTAIPAVLHEALAGQFPESTWVLLPHELGVIASDAARVVLQNAERATAILIGPGFGLEDTTREFLHKLFSESASVDGGEIGFIRGKKENRSGGFKQKPIVMDADGLKLMAKIPGWYKLIQAPAVITPHPGEMSVLTGEETAKIQSDRMATAAKYAKTWGHVVVLKGAFTVIASPAGQIAIIPIATPALARAGTGDVLAGLIVGLRAQGVEAFEAACAGAWIHANAGLLAAKRLGNTASVIAGDVLQAVPEIISGLTGG